MFADWNISPFPLNILQNEWKWYFCFWASRVASLCLSSRTVVEIISSESVDALKNIHQTVGGRHRGEPKLSSNSNKLWLKFSLSLTFLCLLSDSWQKTVQVGRNNLKRYKENLNIVLASYQNYAFFFCRGFGGELMRPASKWFVARNKTA